MSLNSLIQLSTANRLEDLSDPGRRYRVDGDFSGSVGAVWVRLGPKGEGIVNYQGKEYVTQRLGFTSIVPGTPVELTFGNGYYYSKW